LATEEPVASDRGRLEGFPVDRISEGVRVDFKVKAETREGLDALVISVEGELDIATAEQLSEPVGAAVASECPLILDLSACTFIDSTGLRLVLRTHTALSQLGKAMALVSDHVQVRRMLSLTAIDLSVPAFAALDEAIAWIGTEGAEMRSAHSLPHSMNGGPLTASRLP
jgi:anti-sigma B factor antagonist